MILYMQNLLWTLLTFVTHTEPTLLFYYPAECEWEVKLDILIRKSQPVACMYGRLWG